MLDAINGTAESRAMVKHTLDQSPYTGDLIWIESICDDADILANNIQAHSQSPDYAGVGTEEAMRDFQERRAQIARVYESVSDKECDQDDDVSSLGSIAYIKTVNCGKKVTTYNVQGYLPGRIVFFLSHLRLQKPVIWFTRHGQSQYNTTGQIGGNSCLSERGRQFGEELGKFIARQPEVQDEDQGPLSIWCSTLTRTIETAEFACSAVQGKSRAQEQTRSIRRAPPNQQLKGSNDLALPKRVVASDKHTLVSSLALHGKITIWRALAEIEAGIHDGLTYEEVNERDPEGFKLRQKEKLRYRYPQGESYLDVIDRLEAVIFELERAKGPVLVVGHQAVLRCLYGYFLDLPLDDIPHLSVPLHTVIKLTPSAYSCNEQRYNLMQQNEMLSPTTTPHKELVGQSPFPFLALGGTAEEEKAASKGEAGAAGEQAGADASRASASAQQTATISATTQQAPAQ